MCDFLYGYCFYDKKPLDAYELTKNLQYLQKYSDSYRALYKSAAISEYNPMEKHNYQISIPNAYYMNLINSNHNNEWIMGEDL